MGMLKNCCCCCSVKIGCIVLGVLGIIRSALTIGTLSAYFAQILTLISSVMESLHLLKDEENEEAVNMAGDAAQKVQGTIITVFVLILVVFAVDLLFSGLLIAGAVKGRKNLLLPWLVAQVLGILFMVGSMITSMVQLQWDAVGISALIAQIIVILFNVYTAMAVYSHYQDLREEANRLENAPTEMQTRLTSQM